MEGTSSCSTEEILTCALEFANQDGNCIILFPREYVNRLPIGLKDIFDLFLERKTLSIGTEVFFAQGTPSFSDCKGTVSEDMDVNAFEVVPSTEALTKMSIETFYVMFCFLCQGNDTGSEYLKSIKQCQGTHEMLYKSNTMLFVDIVPTMDFFCAGKKKVKKFVDILCSQRGEMPFLIELMNNDVDCWISQFNCTLSDLFVRRLRKSLSTAGYFPLLDAFEYFSAKFVPDEVRECIILFENSSCNKLHESVVKYLEEKNLIDWVQFVVEVVDKNCWSIEKCGEYTKEKDLIHLYASVSPNRDSRVLAKTMIRMNYWKIYPTPDLICDMIRGSEFCLQRLEGASCIVFDQDAFLEAFRRLEENNTPINDLSYQTLFRLLSNAIPNAYKIIIRFHRDNCSADMIASAALYFQKIVIDKNNKTRAQHIPVLEHDLELYGDECDCEYPTLNLYFVGISEGTILEAQKILSDLSLQDQTFKRKLNVVCAHNGKCGLKKSIKLANVINPMETDILLATFSTKNVDYIQQNTEKFCTIVNKFKNISFELDGSEFSEFSEFPEFPEIPFFRDLHHRSFEDVKSEKNRHALVDFTNSVFASLSQDGCFVRIPHSYLEVIKDEKIIVKHPVNIRISETLKKPNKALYDIFLPLHEGSCKFVEVRPKKNYIRSMLMKKA